MKYLILSLCIVLAFLSGCITEDPASIDPEGVNEDRSTIPEDYPHSSESCPSSGDTYSSSVEESSSEDIRLDWDCTVDFESSADMDPEPIDKKECEVAPNDCRIHAPYETFTRARNQITANGLMYPIGCLVGMTTVEATAQRFCEDNGYLYASSIEVSRATGTGYSLLTKQGNWRTSGSRGVLLLDEVVCTDSPQQNVSLSSSDERVYTHKSRNVKFYQNVSNDRAYTEFFFDFGDANENIVEKQCTGGNCSVTTEQQYSSTGSYLITNYGVISLNPQNVVELRSYYLTVGDFEYTVMEVGAPAMIKEIRPDSIDIIGESRWPVGSYEPRTIGIGSEIGYECEGISEILINIDYEAQRVIFLRKEWAVEPGACALR
ncbi:MAG: hypothetical protein OCC49_15900 [Fibrobacterales bacterium]